MITFDMPIRREYIPSRYFVEPTLSIKLNFTGLIPFLFLVKLHFSLYQEHYSNFVIHRKYLLFEKCHYHVKY